MMGINDSPRKRVVSINLSLISYREALNQILELGSKRLPSYACFSNVHMTIEAHHSRTFKEMVNGANFAFADGMPLVFALRLLFGIRQDRIAGMDFTASVLKGCEEKGLSVFLFGSTPETLDAFYAQIKKDYPSLRLAGMISPPFRALSEDETNSMIAEINNAGTHIVLVGLGCPKQEIWMAKNSALINACLLGVGGAFGIYAGTAKRAPEWMRSVGLEWVFRWLQEPRRLFKRYAITNTLFIGLLIKQFFKTK
jgi:N-acetylglucosaminyldiphosphoundecaprenol N-acetyl-beta-D-mannosaminyltransferase